jgi:predicted RND superfamily exporter protein
MEISQQYGKSMIKYFNYIFFSLLLFLFLFFGMGSNISTNIHAMLPSSEKKELFEEFLKFESNKKIFLTINGTDKESLKKIQSIEKEFLEIDGIKKDEFKISTEYLKYQKKYQLYLNKLNIEKLDNLNVESELKKLYKSIFDSFITVDIDTNDPFSLLEKESKRVNIKNGKLLLGEYGYLSVFTIKKEQKSLKQYEQIYDKIKIIEEKHSDIKSFSSIYYYVENSRYIKNDASNIVILATFVLLVLYIVFLRNIKLLINTLITLGSSALLSTIILILIYDKISLFVLVFGISISTIAIDYMFHHYFHRNYENRLGFNKDVFIGFLTTFIAFFILSFVDFLLIKQITQFAMLSLFSSYVIFAFLYPYIKFNQNKSRLRIKIFPIFKSKYILLFSTVILLYSFQNLNFNFDVQSLNYDNKLLKQKELFFKNNLLNEKRQAVILKARTIDELISYNEKIQKIDNNLKSSLNSLISQESFLLKKNELDKLDLHSLNLKITSLSPKIGFKKDTFNVAYQFDSAVPQYSYEKLKEFNISIQKYKDEYISVVYPSSEKVNEIVNFDFVYLVNLKYLFEKSLEDDLDRMINLGLLSLFFIAVVIIFMSKGNILYSLSFLLLPSAFIFLYLSFIDINILHIFMFFIILAISIDYSIYSSSSNNDETKKAIIFSVMSSFAGFGVLVFSSTVSLYSIGSVATLGIMAILILILFEEVQHES